MSTLMIGRIYRRRESDILLRIIDRTLDKDGLPLVIADVYFYFGSTQTINYRLRFMSSTITNNYELTDLDGFPDEQSDLRRDTSFPFSQPHLFSPRDGIRISCPCLYHLWTTVLPNHDQSH